MRACATGEAQTMSLKSRMERIGIRVYAGGKVTTTTAPRPSVVQMTVRVPFGLRRALRARAKRLHLTMSALLQLELQPPRILGLPGNLGRIVPRTRALDVPSPADPPRYTGHDATIVELSVRIQTDLHAQLKRWAKLEGLTLRELIVRALGSRR